MTKPHLAGPEKSIYVNNPFEKLKSLLTKCLSEEISSLLGENATISNPDLLSTESIARVRAEEQMQLQRRYEILSEKFSQYRALTSQVCGGETEIERRSRRLRQLNTFLKWCEELGYDCLVPSHHEPTYQLCQLIRAEVNDLNFVIEGSFVQGREVLCKLGAGGYGTVLKVKRQTPEASYEALKVFHTSNFSEPELVFRFKRGFESMKVLDHPQITKVSEFLLIPRGYFMEFIEGCNLEDFLKDPAKLNYLQTAADRLELLIDICQVIEYAHKEGVRHRDIKPTNIIMRWSDNKNTYEPVLTDFDLAWYMQAIPITLSRAEIVGSYLYSSPEQRSPREDRGLVHRPTVDVFSLGRVLYYIFCQKPPEEDLDMGEFLFQEVRHKFGEVSSRAFAHLLKRIFRKATRVSPAERCQTVEVLGMELEGLLRLLGQKEGRLEEEVFLLELALRLNRDERFDHHEELAKRGQIQVDLINGEMGIKAVDPPRGRAYLQVRIHLPTDRALAIMQQRSFKAAREHLNARIDKFLKEQESFSYRQVQRGKSVDVYSYNFRIDIPDYTFDTVTSLSQELGRLKYVVTR